MSAEARAYRFSDSQRPGLLLGLSARQAVPVVAGVLFLALVLQAPVPPALGLLGPLVGATVAFGRWRGAPLAETVAPATRLWAQRRLGRHRWLRPPLLGDNSDDALPRPLRGLELLERVEGSGMAVVRDRRAGTVTGVLRVRGHGFPLASGREQDVVLAGWSAALSPFARERSSVSAVAWQEWAHSIGADDHRGFLSAIGVDDRAHEPAAADYLALVDQQAPRTVAHDILVSVTVDLRRVRVRRTAGSRLDAAIDALDDELRLFQSRLDAAGLTVDGPLSPCELSSAIRIRSDPSRSRQVTSLGRSLAAAARRGALEWGPMSVETDRTHVLVDGTLHRSFRIASWPQLPVAADWMSNLLTETPAIRTVTVVMEPVPMGRATRAADREVMAREADADMKTQKGFRVNARERKRLADVEARESELSEGHAEFHFVGIVDVTAIDPDQLDDACADVEQAAAQSLLDLRPLDARHDLGWVASLPVGRSLGRPIA
ncbi:MAG: SCO6880 family protein [Microbacteriaceae bacterium]